MDRPYEVWLDISIDHVVPRSVVWGARCSEWVEDISNLVTCCRACREFLDGYRVEVPAPNSASEFFDLRDKVFAEKHDHALKRHEQERQWYERWVRPRLAAGDDSIP